MAQRKYGREARRELLLKKHLTDKKSFDPEGSGYDYESAKAAGLKEDETKHWPSRTPKAGLLLKGRAHPTWHLTEKGEREAGYEIYKGKDGRYYSRKKK